MLVEDGQKISAYVRETFASGHKTGNKFYRMVDTSPFPPGYEGDLTPDEYRGKYDHREEHVWLANKIIAQRPGTFYEIAQWVMKMPIKAGNCVEMAALALYEAVDTYKTPRSLCRECQIGRASCRERV